MYQQREPEASSFRLLGLWDPEVFGEGGQKIHLAPTATDRYGVVDEIIEEVVRLAVVLWPEVDAGGRLRFGTEESHDVAYDQRWLQSELDARREKEHQLQRPLRVGDALFIRGFDVDDPSRWQRVVDITMASRGVAKRAGVRAVAQATEPEPEAARDLSWRRVPEEQDVVPERPPPPAGSTVNPAV